MRLLYHATAHAPVRIVFTGAVWWSTGKIARAFHDGQAGYDNGIEVTLYERDRGTERRAVELAWFDRDGNFVCYEDGD